MKIGEIRILELQVALVDHVFSGPGLKNKKVRQQ